MVDRVLRLGARIVLAAAVGLLLIPAALIAVLSFSNDPFIKFPPRSWGFDRYETLVSSDIWLPAVWESARIGVPAALISVLVGVSTVLVVHRTRLPGRGIVQDIAVATLIIPISSYALALFGVFAQLDLVGTRLGVILSHTVLAVPLVMLLVGSALSRMPADLEFVAMNLGASRARAWVGITLRILLPALVASLIVAFVTSFDEAVFINFIGGGVLVTLPKAIFDSVRYGVDPVITSIATVLMVATIALVALSTLLQREQA
jgi:ABC-type spermidine/putrescine transport system permease subunit II